MERAEAIGEAPEDPLLLFSFLWGVWSGSYVKFNGEAMKALASQFMTLAERQGTTIPMMVGHRLVGMTALHTSDIIGSRQHFDRAIALYNPAEHRALAPRFGQDIRVAALAFRALTLWLLGHPALALADIENALKDGREIDHGPSLMYALHRAAVSNMQLGYYAAASKHADEMVIFATQKGVGFWKALGVIDQGAASAFLGNTSDAVQKIASAINAYRSMGSTVSLPEYLGYLANAHAQLGQFDEAFGCIREAMTAVETTGERWREADLERIAGEIALNSSRSDAARAEIHFERATFKADRAPPRQVFSSPAVEPPSLPSQRATYRREASRSCAGSAQPPCGAGYTPSIAVRERSARALRRVARLRRASAAQGSQRPSCRAARPVASQRQAPPWCAR